MPNALSGAEAAKQIKALIGDSVEKVELGARLAGDAGSTMKDIVAQQNAALVEESAAAAEAVGIFRLAAA